MSVLRRLLTGMRAEWNHPWLAALVGGTVALAGFTVGVLALPHVVEFDSNLFKGLSVAVFGGAVTLGGMLLFAVLE